MGSKHTNSRQVAFLTLLEIDKQQTYTDIALERILGKFFLETRDRSLVNQLVYGVIRHQRSLDALLDLLGKKKAHQQPPQLRRILHLGLYQLRYLNQIPDSAAVNTSVELAILNGLGKLKGVVNGVLRNYLRQTEQQDLLALAPHLQPSNQEDLTSSTQDSATVQLSKAEIEQLGIWYSFPNWIIANWLEQLSLSEVLKLLYWFNQPGKIEIRINPLQTSVDEVASALENVGVSITKLPQVPQGIRIESGAGNIRSLPGYQEGWWMVQDSSAQLVSHILDPQPGEMIIDLCAAPGGKSTHIAELMGDQGTIWACDRSAKRLKKVAENSHRLKLNSIQALATDGLSLERFHQQADRVLVDAPCSGLGTLHKRPDIRWRQSPHKIAELVTLQKNLLKQAATLVKPQGTLVYATCTLNLQENEAVIQAFLDHNQGWKIVPPSEKIWHNPKNLDHNWLKIYPHQYNMDGFFIAKLVRTS